MIFANAWRRLGYLATAEGREFLRLDSGRERYHPLSNVRFEGLIFDVPDAPSFLGQYVDIFRSSSYFFHCDRSGPVVYDCGANVGVSVANFKMLYPDARVTAFEPDENVFVYLSSMLFFQYLKEMDRVLKRNGAIVLDIFQDSDWSADVVSVYVNKGTLFPVITNRALLESVLGDMGLFIVDEFTEIFSNSFSRYLVIKRMGNRS